jgi:hypothetical protein
VADVQWPVNNAIRPGFQILADSDVAGRTHEDPMIFGTTAVDRQSTLDLRPITKQSIGGASVKTSGKAGAQIPKPPPWEMIRSPGGDNTVPDSRATS